MKNNVNTKNQKLGMPSLAAFGYNSNFPTEDKSVRAYLKYLEENPKQVFQVIVDSKPFFTLYTDGTYDSHGNSLAFCNHYDGIIDIISARDRLRHQCSQPKELPSQT